MSDSEAEAVKGGQGRFLWAKKDCYGYTTGKKHFPKTTSIASLCESSPPQPQLDSFFLR